MDLPDALPATPARDGMVGQWYRAVCAYFARERRLADAQRHFDRARARRTDGSYDDRCARTADTMSSGRPSAANTNASPGSSSAANWLSMRLVGMK